MKPNTIYLDYNATTPVDPRVLEAMLPYFKDKFGNSVSASHSYGWEADKAVEKAREQVAELINCHPHEIYFTSGATESNNWAIRGLVDQLWLESQTAPAEFISSPAEHSSVVSAFKSAAKLFPHLKVNWASPNRDGAVTSQEVAGLITPRTKLLSLMWINNEVGSINPIQQLAELAHEKKCYFHSDATQAIGKVRVDLQRTAIDLLSFSGHKIYGPKGIGVLYQRKQNPKVQIQPLLHGGGHERGARSGTLNVPAIVGLGKACQISKDQLEADIAKLKSLRDLLWQELQIAFPSCRLNGPALEERAANNLNVTFVGCTVPPSFSSLAVSKGSACVSGAVNSSPVLRALGLSENEASRTLRITLGRPTTASEIHQAVSELKCQVHMV